MTGREWQAIAAHTGATYLRYSFTKGTAQEVEWIVGHVAPAAPARVLDVGCGPGRHSRALAERGFEVVGLDVSLPFLAAAGEGTWVQADARRLPFPPGCFDVVLCLCQGGFGLLGGSDDEEVFTGLAAMLRIGGKLVLSAFSSYFVVAHLDSGDTFDAASGVNHECVEVLDAERHRASFDLWTTCFTPRELRLMATRAGLRVDSLSSVAPGDYAERPPDLAHPEWLVVATRTGPRGRASERSGVPSSPGEPLAVRPATTRPGGVPSPERQPYDRPVLPPAQPDGHLRRSG